MENITFNIQKKFKLWPWILICVIFFITLIISFIYLPGGDVLNLKVGDILTYISGLGIPITILLGKFFYSQSQKIATPTTAAIEETGKLYLKTRFAEIIVGIALIGSILFGLLVGIHVFYIWLVVLAILIFILVIFRKKKDFILALTTPTIFIGLIFILMLYLLISQHFHK